MSVFLSGLVHCDGMSAPYGEYALVVFLSLRLILSTSLNLNRGRDHTSTHLINENGCCIDKQKKLKSRIGKQAQLVKNGNKKKKNTRPLPMLQKGCLHAHRIIRTVH